MNRKVNSWGPFVVPSAGSQGPTAVATNDVTMAASRTLTALFGLVGSLAISAAIYAATGSLLLFLLVPFVPFLLSRSPGEESPGPTRAPPRECPACDFRARNPEFDYCPRDGRRLRDADER